MNRISLISFLIGLCISCSMHSKPEYTEQEMTVFYDPRVHAQKIDARLKKIDTRFLNNSYNLRKLRKIIFYTEQHGTPPDHTLELFKQFMNIGYNYIAFGPFVEKQVKTYIEDPNKASQMADTLHNWVWLACLAHSEEECRKELLDVEAKRTRLEAAMGLGRLQAE